MANAAYLPTYTNNKFFFWNAKLTDSLAASTTEQSIFWDTIPVDENGITITGLFLIACRNTRKNPNRTEMMWVPASAVAADGLSATGVVRGLKPSGIDFTTGDSDFVYEFDSGDEIFCAILPQDGELLRSAIQGVIGTGASDFRIGDGTAGNKTIYAQNADSNKPYIRYDDTSNQWIISNDGTSSFVVGTGAGSITGGDGITVTAGDIDIDVTDTTIFKNTTAGAIDAGKIPRLNGSGLLDYSFLGTDGTVTASNLNTLTNGSDASSLHSHSSPTLTLWASEALTAGQAVGLLPIEVEYFDQLTDTDLSLGDDNARARYAIKFVPSVTSSSLTTMQFRAKEQSAGNTTLGDLTISIQSDSAGAPSGTAITNGTANAITQATQRTWGASYANRTATWATPPTLTAGTTYWIVFQTASLSATQYLRISVNSSHDENYITFTRLTYDAFSGTWGGSTTNATPYFWFNTQQKLLGVGLVPCDASWGARTWSYIGGAVSTVSANSSASVYYDIIPGLSGLIPGKYYWLSETTGQYTLTAPTCEYQEGTEPTAFAYRVARAISTTQLKIDLGPKRVPIRETTQITATTTRQYRIWFQPEFIRVAAVGGPASTTDGSHSYGYVRPDGSDASVFVETGAASAYTAGGSTTASALVDEDGASNGFTGAASSITDAGFTYTLTEQGTGGIFLLLEPIA